MGNEERSMRTTINTQEVANHIRYCAPDTVLVPLDYDSIIADSMLEGIEEGDDWVWED